MTCPFCKSGKVGLCSVDEDGSEHYHCYSCKKDYVGIEISKESYDLLQEQLEELKIPDYIFYERWANWMMANRWYLDSHFDKPLEEWDKDKLKSLKRFIEVDLSR